MSSPPTVSSVASSSPGERASDDGRWFKQEVLAHETSLRAYLRRKYPQLHEVDDVVQESYLRIFRARLAGNLRSVRGFLFTTARNAALDLFRHRAVVPMEPLTAETESSVFQLGADAAETASVKQELEILAAVMEDLPDRCRQILLLRRIHGLSHKEIADQLGISEHTVEKQVGIGLKKCVDYLKQRGVDLRRP